MKSSVEFLLWPFRALFLSLLSMIMGERGRRIFLSTTLFFQIVDAQTEKQRRELVKVLNTALGLAKDSDALLLPALLHRKIWNDDQLDQVITAICSDEEERHRMTSDQLPEDVVERLSQSLANLSPKWLSYGKDGVMARDIKSVLRCYPASLAT